MFRFLTALAFFVLLTATAEAQGNLSEVFSILRTEGPTLSASGRTRMFQILDPYAAGEKNLDGEWESVNAALSDANPFVRNQACAALSTIIYFGATRAFVNSAQRIRVPESTREVVIQRFNETQSNTRENAVRIIALMDGGVPPALVPKLLQMARTDAEGSVRQAAIGGLALIPTPSPEITDFWVQSLNDVPNKELRGSVLSAFRSKAPTDPRIILLVVDALRDTDYFVRQEAIAVVIEIGKPAAAAIPLLNEIRDAPVGDARGQTMRGNAESAIRILSASPANR